MCGACTGSLLPGPQVRASSVNGTGLPLGGKAHLDDIQRAIGAKIGMAARTASTNTVSKTSRAIGKFVGAAGAAAAAGKLKYKALKAAK